MGRILSKSKENQNKLVGASMPSQFHEYMSLYAVAKQLKKSDVVKKLISDWHKIQLNLTPEDNLIEEIANHAYSQLRKKETEEKVVSLTKFHNALEKELLSKGLTTDTINSILLKLKWKERNSQKP